MKNIRMRNRLVLGFMAVIFTSCEVKEQADKLKALESCTYEIVSADSVYIAGTDARQLLQNGGLNIFQAPQLAFAYMQQKMPVKAKLQLKVTNNGTEEAGINKFEYKVLIQDTEILDGFIDQQITVSPSGGTALVPVRIDKDFYPLISNQTNQQAVTNFLTSQTEQKMVVTFRIKPRFVIGTQEIEYPDFIDVKKELTNTVLLSYLKAKNQP
ncbi:hypothetical protein ACFSJU_14510 [Paradesertivirga mongoliensis]|uniref:Late embryogenesis abundant protein n=1 Tax=Paradesertivirga mongoliensis TaxID=2100740 RepID=A0ABW4ZP00_9SPHI|nr:hypothetical protein [Pedobacter mongoliensis]